MDPNHYQSHTGYSSWHQQPQQYSPTPPPPVAGAGTPPDHVLQHRFSTVSAMNDSDYELLRPSESMVSLNTEYRRTPQPLQHHYQQHDPQPQSYTRDGDNEGHTYSSQGGWSVPFMRHPSQGYTPVSEAGAGGGGNDTVGTKINMGGSMSRNQSQMYSYRDRAQYSAIPEEESIDLSLLSTAAPMGYANNYGPEPTHETTEHVIPGVDLTAFESGPDMSNPSPDSLEDYQAAEASGQLTGGIGSGWRPEATIRGEDLLALSASPERTPMGLGRAFSRRKSKLGRRDTLRALGQEEANRRGEIVEVILEDDDIQILPAAKPSDIDLSLIVGPATLNQPGNRTSSFAVTPDSLKTAKTQMFFPEPNWKPFSMQWPYLSFIILLSIGLAVAQEIAYQKSPLLEFRMPDDVPPAAYFAVKFLPTVITVAYGVLWQFTDFEVRRLEAFYQLSKPGGALAAESINVDYITAFSFFRPIRALKLKHYAVAISSVATVISVSLVPTLGAASIFLSPSRDVRNLDPTGLKQIMINPIWSRILTVVFCLCAVMAMSLFWLLHKRVTGLNNDVKGIAGLASMAVVSHILTDFKDLDVAPPKDIHARLKYHRYMLRNSSLAPDNDNPVTRQDAERYEKTHLSDNPHPLMLRPAGAIPFIIWILAFLVFIPVFLFTPAEIVTSRAPWVVTIIAVSIKLAWGSLDTDIRMMEPYYILFNRHAPPRTLCLDYTALPFGWMPIRALINRHWLVFFVGFGTVMTEMLTVLVTSLATVEGRAFAQGIFGRRGDPDDLDDSDDNDLPEVDAGQETVSSFLISLSLAAFILIYMAVVATLVFLRRRHPFLPRLPNTIASVLAFIHQSKMLYDFTGTEKLNNAQMVRRLEGIGKKYGLGWFEGRDGQTHCGVDQEELSGNYRHGMNYEAINKPWVGNWETYEG